MHKSVYSTSYYTSCPRFIILVLLFMMTSCKHGAKVYESECDEEQTFTKISFKQLLDSMTYYDQQYVEVTGVYREGKEKSALYSEVIYTKPDTSALWVNFSPECPLYLKGTNIGFFDYNNGSFTQINNKKVRLRGKVDIHNKGHLKLYKGCIDHISMVAL